MAFSTNMSRRDFLRRAGLGAGTAAVIGAGALSYRAYDQGVFEIGHGPAYQPWDDWQHGSGPLALVGAAILAPSPHNSQSWRFGVGANHVDVHADTTRATGSLDPYLREMHVGLGAAVENVVLTASARGLAPVVVLFPNGPGSSHVAHVALARGQTRGQARPVALADQIPRRHTNRYPFDTDRELPPAALSEMSGLVDAGASEISLLWLTGAERDAMGELLVAATANILDDAEQRASDARWFRQSWDDVQHHRDGITLDTAGLPDLTLTLAKLLPAQSPRATGEAWLTATRDRHTRTAAAYGIIAVRDVRDRFQQVEGGRLFQRAHLWATEQGIAFHPMNQATERADREVQLGLSPRIGSALGQLLPADWHALCAFRVGHPTRRPRPSPRRPVEAVILR